MTTNSAPTEPLAERCATHREVETYLRCGRCGTPICPRCLVQTPVGARCRACARVRRLPVYDVGPRFLLRGGLAALVGAFVGGFVLLALFGGRFGLGLFSLLIGALFGYGLAGLVGWAVNHKRGASLGWLTVGALVLGYGAARSVLVFSQLEGLPLEPRLARAFGLGFGLDLSSLVLLFVAGLVAYTRLR